MNHKKVMKLLDDEAGILIEKLPIIYESDIHEMRRRLKEVLNDFILETYSKGAVDIQ